VPAVRGREYRHAEAEAGDLAGGEIKRLDVPVCPCAVDPVEVITCRDQRNNRIGVGHGRDALMPGDQAADVQPAVVVHPGDLRGRQLNGRERRC